jgi:hypothetical protein
MKRPPQSGFTLLVRHNVDRVQRFPLFIAHFERPFSIGAEVAVDVVEYLASYQRSFVPGGFVIPQFLSHVIGAAADAVGVEKYLGIR